MKVEEQRTVKVTYCDVCGTEIKGNFTSQNGLDFCKQKCFNEYNSRYSDIKANYKYDHEQIVEIIRSHYELINSFKKDYSIHDFIKIVQEIKFLK